MEHLRRIRLREQVQVPRRDAQPVRAHLHLTRRLLPGDVKDRAVRNRLRDALERGEQERALADPGIAAEEDERPRHDSSTQDAVELADAGLEPRLLARSD